MNRRSFCLSAAALATLAARPGAWSQARPLASANGRILLGVDYYPDQTPEALWKEDAERMAAAGINNVRLAEFAWSLMEPSEGQFHFEWLQRAVRLLHAHGIEVILGTPSAAPAQWVAAKYPEVLLVNEQGVTMTPNSRRYTCPTNATYRRLSSAIASRMAETFAKEPGVIGWQIDNEFGLASFPRCYCPSCRAGFQQWVKAKYGTLDAVNAAWGTSFWSQVYTDFSQIPTPLPSPAPPNPGYALDYDRFQSDTYVSYQREQLQILRKTCPGHFITTNNVAGLSINLRDLYRDLDFPSPDNYPAFISVYAHTDPAVLAPVVSLSLDQMRWAKQGAPFLVMEQQSGKSGQPFFSPQPQQGQVRLWTYQAVAHGAMGINYFRWDTARFGAEEYWHGLLNHDRSNSPAFDEIVRTIHELKALDPDMLRAPVHADVAVAYDPDSDWAVSIQPGHSSFRYGTEVTTWYSAAWLAHAGVDCVDLADDLSRYKAVMMPMHYVLTEAQARGAMRYVQNGGTLIVGYRSGVKTGANQVIDVPRPGLLRELTGVTVADYAPMYSGKQGVKLDASLGGTQAMCDLWYEVLTPGRAEVLATYTDGDAAGKPAITRNRVGKGTAYYVGSRLDGAGMVGCLSAMLSAAGVKAPVSAPQGVEVAQRTSGSRHWLLLMNHTAADATVTLPGSYRNALTKAEVKGSITLPRYGVAVLAS